MQVDQQTFYGQQTNNLQYQSRNPTGPITEPCIRTLNTGTDLRIPTYIKGNINGHNSYFLVDTGCDTCILPARLANGLLLQERKSILKAANGTTINSEGVVELSFALDDQTFHCFFVVTPDVDEIIIGQSFIRVHKVSWLFDTNTIVIDGRSHLLHINSQPACCRRILMADNVVVPPLSQVTITAQAPIRTWSSVATHCILDTTEPINGLFIARSIVSPTSAKVPLTICNTRNTPLTIHKGIQLGMTEPTEAVEYRTPEEPAMSIRDIEIQRIIEQIIASLPSDLTEEHRQHLSNVLFKYSHCLSLNEFDLGFTDLVEHTIDTGNAAPIRQTLRRQPLAYQAQIDEHVQQMLKAGVIIPSTSPWSSNVCLVKKRDGKLRFAIDYRHLNAITTIPAYPMPRVDSCLDCLGNSAWYTTMDLRAAFWQVKQSQKDAPKTAFVTRTGCYQFTRLPFGLSGSPGLFQRLADLIFSGLTWEALLVFLDDIIIFGSTIEQHIERIEHVFQRLSTAGLKITPAKCHFFKKQVTFLGFNISQQGIQTDPSKTEAIVQWPTPTNVKQVRSFCATINYYRKHIHQFSIIAAPLFDLQKKKSRFIWTAEHDRAFNTLKMRLTTAPVLAIFDPTKPTLVDCDASGSGLGAVLSQMVDGQERVVAYASRTLNTAERNYSITKRELLGVIFALKQFRQYVLGIHFVLRTDHEPLRHLQSLKDPPAQMGRWLDRIQEFQFKVEHRAGSHHGNADGLSRRHDESRLETDVETSPAFTQYRSLNKLGVAAIHEHITHNSLPLRDHLLLDVDWAAEQRNDLDISPIYKAISHSTNEPPTSQFISTSAATKNLLAQWQSLTMVNNVLYRTWLDADRNIKWLQVIVPFKLQEAFIIACHAGMTGGHLGPRKTAHQVQRRAYFQGWRSKSYRICRQCTACASHFRGKIKHQACMQPMLTGNPMEKIGIDLCGPFPKSYDNKVYILTCTDYFSKWTECIPLQDKQAHTVAKALVDNVFTRLGCPWEIVSDQGPEFDNALLKSLCERFHITKLRTTAYHPNANGVAERMHRTLNSMMGRVVSEQQTDWTDYLQPLMCAYRAAIHSSTGYSPNFIIMGREINMPLDIIIQTPSESTVTSDAYVDRVQRILHDCHWKVREQLQTTTVINKRYYDLKATKTRYKIGDWVWFYKPRHLPSRCPKWERLYSGPYRIMKTFNNVNVVIQQSASSQPIVTHIDKLKPFVGQPPADFTTNTETIDTNDTSTQPGDEQDHADATEPPVENTNSSNPPQNHQPNFTNVPEVRREVITRSNRHSRLPSKYNDYVC